MNSRPAPGSPFPPTGRLITAIRDVCCYGHLADRHYVQTIPKTRCVDRGAPVSGSSLRFRGNC